VTGGASNMRTKLVVKEKKGGAFGEKIEFERWA
jgi:hypothetical protein